MINRRKDGSLFTEEQTITPVRDERGEITHFVSINHTQQMIGWDGQSPVPESYRLKPPYDQIAAFRSQAFANVPLVVQGRASGCVDWAEPIHSSTDQRRGRVAGNQSH